MKSSINYSPLKWWANRIVLWSANHWLALINLFFFIYIALPIIAPLMLAAGYSTIPLIIYRIYGLTCHQLPSHSYFLLGHQVALCQRCTAIHGAMVITGLLYILQRFRLPPLSFKWYLFFLIPMGIDGGMQLVSELLVVVPAMVLWAIGLGLIALLSGLLYWQQALVWQAGIFFAAGPVSLMSVQLAGPYESNWQWRTITGAIYAFGTVWLVYPLLEESFQELRQQTQERLT